MNFFYNREKLKDIATETVRLARRNGADAAQVDISESASMEVEVRGGSLDGMDINRGQELSVTVYVNNHEGSASVGNLTAAAARTAIEKALSIARAGAADPCVGLADQMLMAKHFYDLSLHHPWDISPEQAITLACECETGAWEVNPAINRKKSEAAVSTSMSQNAYANSHGFCVAEAATAHTISCAVIAEKEGQMERDGWSETRRQASVLPAAAIVGHDGGMRAVQRLGGKNARAGRVNVLFQAPVSHSLIYHILGAASGGALYRKTSWLLNKLDKPVCAPHFNIWEQPHLPGEMRSANYDDEGVATHPRVVVEDGIWRGCFLSAYSARRLNRQTTGNAGGAHNLEVSGNTLNKTEMMQALDTGLIVTELMGQGVNSVNGDYSRGAAGFWVENGEIIHPVSEAAIAGNLLDMLPSIIAVGDDVMRRGLVRCGSILIPHLMVGGSR